MFEGKRKEKKSVNEGLGKFMPTFAVFWRVVVGVLWKVQIFANICSFYEGVSFGWWRIQFGALEEDFGKQLCQRLQSDILPRLMSEIGS